MNRLMVVGDVHGCADELEELYAKARMDDQDTVILTGDICDRGPKSKEVLTFLKAHKNIHMVLGNHDLYHLKAAEKGILPQNASALIEYHEMGKQTHDELIDYLKKQPVAIRTPYCEIFHAVRDPRKPLEEQDPELLCGDREKHRQLEKELGMPWYEAYRGDVPLIVGHINYHWEQKKHEEEGKPFVHVNRYGGKIIGADTGVDFGHALSGIIFPGEEIVTVPSKANHWEEKMKQYHFSREMRTAQIQGREISTKMPVEGKPFPTLPYGREMVTEFDPKTHPKNPAVVKLP